MRDDRKDNLSERGVIPIRPCDFPGCDLPWQYAGAKRGIEFVTCNGHKRWGGPVVCEVDGCTEPVTRTHVGGDFRPACKEHATIPEEGFVECAHENYYGGRNCSDCGAVMCRNCGEHAHVGSCRQSPLPDSVVKAPFVIGTDVWPGLGKLIEECGELLQVLGKLIAYPAGTHPDGGPPLQDRLSDESADVQAALTFLHAANAMVQDYNRIDRKVDTFHGWHEEGLNREQ